MIQPNSTEHLDRVRALGDAHLFAEQAQEIDRPGSVNLDAVLSGQRQPERPALRVVEDEDEAPACAPLPPLPLECLPDPLAVLADHMAGIWKVDPALYAVPGLAILSAAIGNTVWLKLPGKAVAPAVLWLGLVARTGSGKTPAAEVVSEPLVEIQNGLDRDYGYKRGEWDQLSKGEKEKQQRPQPSLITVTDTSWESAVVGLAHNPGGMLWARDEIGGVFKQLDAYHAKGGNFAAEDLLSTWSQQPIRRKRLTDGEYTVALQPFLAIYGGIQPARASQLGNNEGGRLSRLLVYQTNRRPELEGDEPRPDVLERWTDLVTRLLRGRLVGGRNRLLTLSDEARDLWKVKQRERAQELQEADDETAAYLAKLDQHAGRLAVIKHTCDHLDDLGTPVSADTVLFGWQLARVFVDHQLATFRPTVSDFVVRPEQRAEDHAVMVLDAWVVQQGGRARRRDAQNHHIGGARLPSDFQRLVARWLEEGLGHEETETGGRGRPAVWLIKGRN